MKTYITLFLFCSSSFLFGQNVGINTTGANPNASALLDVDAGPANDKGMLIPRVSLQAINSALPIASPATSLLVYNTATAGVAPNNVLPGFYYWNGSNWVSISDATNNSNWNLTGNGNTSAATHFLGTSNLQDLIFKTNGTERMRFNTTGEVGINNPNPKLPLSFKSVVGDKISLYESGNGLHYGMGIQSGLFQVYTSASSSDIAFGYGSSAAMTENMRIKGNGNVGVGTVGPATKLHIVSNQAIAPLRIQNTLNTNYSGIHFMSDVGAFMGHIGYANTGTGTFPGLVYAGSIAAIPYVLTTTDLERFRISATGEIGINNTNPAFPLSFNSAFGDKISLSGAAGAHYGMGVQNNLFQIHSFDANSDIAFGYGSSAAFTEALRIKGTGKVGIGTTNPQAELEVNGFTKLGSTAPAIKTLKILSTTAATQGAFVGVPHGLNAAKILSISVTVEYGANVYVFEGNKSAPGYEFYVNLNNTNINVINLAANSANILSKPMKIFITYEQ